MTVRRPARGRLLVRDAAGATLASVPWLVAPPVAPVPLGPLATPAGAASRRALHARRVHPRRPAAARHHVAAADAARARARRRQAARPARRSPRPAARASLLPAEYAYRCPRSALAALAARPLRASARPGLGAAPASDADRPATLAGVHGPMSDRHPLHPPGLPPVRRRPRGARAPPRRARLRRSRRSTSRPTTRCTPRYLERIPVVALDGEELFDYFVDEERSLRGALCYRGAGMSFGDVATSPAATQGDGRRAAGRPPLARRGRPALALPPGPDPGPQDGQGDDLLAGAVASTPTSTRRRSAATCPASASSASAAWATTSTRWSRQIRKILRTSGPAQHRAVRRRPPRQGDRLVGHLRRPRLPRRGDLRPRPGEDRREGRHRGRSAIPTTSSRSSRRRTSSSASSPSRPPPPRRSPTSWSTPGVKIIFNYSEALLQVPPEVTVHTSSPAVDLLYALYFYLT